MLTSKTISQNNALTCIVLFMAFQNTKRGQKLLKFIQEDRRKHPSLSSFEFKV